MPNNKIVLAYSGGLDTSVAVPWLKEKYGADVITLTIDLGMVDLEAIRQRALAVGACESPDCGRQARADRILFVPGAPGRRNIRGPIPPGHGAGAPPYCAVPGGDSSVRGAFAVAHGCTGKGNDQVRIEVSVAALAPELELIAPIRDWGMSRVEEIEYAQARNLPVNARNSRFSVDENLWGRSVEAGELEDPWMEPPEEAYAWTRPVLSTPDEPAYLEVHFETGVPTAVDGEDMAGPDLIRHVNTLAGSHGVGRLDQVENRLVGIKSREVYEAPAAVVLHAAHKSLEALTLSKEQSRIKERIAQEYADVVYNGLWFTPHRQDLDAYVRSTQRHVTGDVRVRLHKGSCVVVGRSAPRSLYQHDLATYDRGDQYDHAAAQGFISIYGLPIRTQNRVQRE